MEIAIEVFGHHFSSSCDATLCFEELWESRKPPYTDARLWQELETTAEAHSARTHHTRATKAARTHTTMPAGSKVAQLQPQRTLGNKTGTRRPEIQKAAMSHRQGERERQDSDLPETDKSKLTAILA
eukprot:10695-Heterococcus_DN1.PRE.1